MNDNVLSFSLFFGIFVSLVLVAVLIIKEMGIETTIYGKGSLLFAIIGFLSLFSLLPALLVYDLFIFYLSLLLIIEFFAVFLGSFSYWIKKPRDGEGKIGIFNQLNICDNRVTYNNSTSISFKWNDYIDCFILSLQNVNFKPL